MNNKPTAPIAQTALFADVLPNGNGGFVIRPNKPMQEIGTLEVTKILGVSRATMWALRNHPVAGKILKWRFTSLHKRKVKYETASVLAYLEYTQTLGK